MDKTEAAKLLRKAWDGTSSNGPFLHVDIGDAKAIADLLDPPVQPPEHMPEDYKWDGEYRLPKRGEWFIAETNGEAEKASFDWSKKENRRYIIYPIAPKFKPGDIVMSRHFMRFVTKDGLVWSDGMASSDDMEGYRDATDADIITYFKEYPKYMLMAIKCLAEFYAKEAKEAEAQA